MPNMSTMSSRASRAVSTGPSMPPPYHQHPRLVRSRNAVPWTDPSQVRRALQDDHDVTGFHDAHGMVVGRLEGLAGLTGEGDLTAVRRRSPASGRAIQG